ncbi:MAG: hypothetical protein A2W99_08360 [Bacteroidetes bacterium GWF2_33_16]|nr:MAG: hypothetical protein A2X00_00795 [Bacteroidetes bacterium GWE2_32_14]OFY05517.1 MAG: hypothetical protein A2W99_08360 [Bacteroidetes bacterium GWF2_33_16]
MIKFARYTILLILFSFIILNGNSQIKSIGIPNITNFSRQDYNASTQNWAALQDKRGILYFGNNEGLLEFDGVHWRLIQMPNTSAVRSICTDKSGTIYVGAFGEFGYLKTGENGKLKYISFVELVPDYLRNFGDIWKIYETENGIIFQSFSEIFLYKNNTLKVIAQKRFFHFSFLVNGELYITEKNKGLLKLKDEKLIPIKGGKIFDNNIWTMLPFKDNRILIGTTKNGLYVLENDSVNVWNVPSNPFLKQNHIYCATKVKDYFAIGTILNGLVIIDEKGIPKQHVNRDKGLQNNTVLSIYADNSDNLWLGLDNGIDYVLTNSPFTNIVNESKIGAGYVSYIFKNKLYLGTNQGLFYKEWSEPENPLKNNLDFKMIENTQGQVWSIYEFNNKLYCGHNNGTYVIDNEEAKLISENMGGWLLLNVPDKENTMLQGTYAGILKYETTNNISWKITKIGDFNESCRMIEPYLGKDNYTLWISHVYKGIYRIDLNKNLDKINQLHFYDSLNGLTTNFGNNVLRFNDEIIFTNKTGIYNYNEDQQRFELNNELMRLFGENGSVRKIFKDNYSHWWFIQGNKMGMIKKLSDGSYKVDREIFNSFSGNFVRDFEHLYPYNDESVIIATENGFAHFSKNFIKETDIPFNTLIRSIKTTNDSIIFDGAFADSSGNIINTQLNNQIQYLPFRYNNIKIEYSSTYYENIKDIVYKYYLEGFDHEWSEWTKRTVKEYTNLKEGNYVFKVKAKNVFNIESEVSSYKFVIHPPWYRSLVAYIAYVSLIILVTWITIITIRKRIEIEKRRLKLKQKKELHQQKINHKNEVLSAQQEIVKLRNEKLRIENEKNKAEVELKTKELASYAMQITQKNETLYSMKEQLVYISKKINPDAQKYLQKLIKSIEEKTNKMEDWEKFEGYFDHVYENFTKRIREKYPNLTPNDIKLCAYLRMNMTTKEIAPLLNISVRGVEISRYRLRKKLNLPQNENLIDFLMNL